MTDNSESRHGDDQVQAEASWEEWNNIIADEIIARYPHAQAAVEWTFYNRDMDDIGRRNRLAEILGKEQEQARKQPDVISPWRPARSRRWQTDFDQLNDGSEESAGARTALLGTFVMKLLIAMGNRSHERKQWLREKTEKFKWHPKN